MKKLIFITLILTLVLAMSAFGSNTRTLTMGNNNAIMVDDANIWLFPSRINDYPGLAIAEVGAGDVTRFGIHWQFGDDSPWVMATYFEANLGTFFGPYWGVPFTPPDSNRRIHWFYGRDLGANKFGLRFSLYNSSAEYSDSSPTSSKVSFSYYDTHWGLTADDNSWDLALNIGFGTWTDELGGVAILDADGMLDFSLTGRMFMDKGPRYTYAPHAGIEYHKLGWLTPSVTPALEEKLTAFIVDLGIGQVYTPSNDVEAVFDFGIRMESKKYEFTDGTDTEEEKFKFTTIPYFKIGMDAEVFSWMDVRFGATSFWQRFKDEFSEVIAGTAFSSEDKLGYADNATYLGFGFHWGNFHVDTYADPQLFLEGLNFISGGNETMNFQISATYEML